MPDNEDYFKKQNRSLKSFLTSSSIDSEEAKSGGIEDRSEFNDCYTIKEEIGIGGLKSVYRVRDRRTGRDVALAQLKKEYESSVNTERFLREARILASLEHTNIVPIHEINYDKNNRLFFTMKLLEGETLADILKKLKKDNSDYTEKYSIRTLLGIFIRVCEAISYAHSKNTVHLDIKPENIQISNFGEVSVIDWGMAKIIGDDENIIYEESDIVSFTPVSTNPTKAGSISGTPGYMSPEQCDDDDANIGIASDIYSLGATLYSILYKNSPYKGNKADDIINKTRDGIAPSYPGKCNKHFIPTPLTAIVKKAMKRETQERYDSVEDLKEDIIRYLNDFSTHAENISLNKIIFLFLKRHQKASLTIASTLLIICLISTFFLSKIQERDDKIRATADEVIFGTLSQEDEKRFAFKFDELIQEYEELVKLGYNYPIFKFQLARLYTGELKFKQALKLLSTLKQSNSTQTQVKEFQILYNSLKTFISEGNDPAKQKDVLKFCERLQNSLHDHRMIKVHIYHSLYKRLTGSLSEKTTHLKEFLLADNPRQRGKLNINHEVKNDEVYVDLSKNARLTFKGALIPFRINHLNISDTNIGFSGYLSHTISQKHLKSITYDRSKNPFSDDHLPKSNVEKIIARYCDFPTTNLKELPKLKYLDVEGCDFKGHFWQASHSLEHLNIAFSNFFDFESLGSMRGLKTVVISKSLNIPEKTIRRLRGYGTKIMIKKESGVRNRESD